MKILTTLYRKLTPISALPPLFPPDRFLGWSWPLHVPPRNSTNVRNQEENAPRPLLPQNEEVLEALDQPQSSLFNQNDATYLCNGSRGRASEMISSQVQHVEIGVFEKRLDDEPRVAVVEPRLGEPQHLQLGTSSHCRRNHQSIILRQLNSNCK